MPELLRLDDQTLSVGELEEPDLLFESPTNNSNLNWINAYKSSGAFAV
jgi:hypothetical protein